MKGDEERIGRNDPCHCGSGRKYKDCHLREEEAYRSEQLKLRQVVDVVFDVLVLALVIRLAIGGGDRTRAYLFMTAGWLVLVAADAGRALLVLLGTYDPSSPIEAGWLVSYALWGAAVLEPSVATLTDSATPLHEVDTDEQTFTA